MKHCIGFLAILSFFLACGHANADIEWEILNDEVNELHRTGKYDRAVIVAKKALELAEESGPNNVNVATSLNSLALLYKAQGEYALAEPLYKRSLKIYEKALGPDHPSVATSLENLASLYRLTNRHKEAKDLELRATEIQTIKR